MWNIFNILKQNLHMAGFEGAPHTPPRGAAPRSALFVDLAYLLSGVATAIGVADETAIGCDFCGLAPAFGSFVAAHSGLEMLRSYWYDAPGPTGPRPGISELRKVERTKVRLGALGWEGQKEVDILLHDDLTALAAGGHVASIYLLSGDADFRPTVERAQVSGVEVNLLDIVGGRPATALRQEADLCVLIPDAAWRPFFTALAAAAATIDARRDGQALAQRAGAQFARRWLRDVDPELLARLQRQGHWRLPPDLDRALIRAADQTTAGIRDHPRLRTSGRAGFWSALVDKRPAHGASAGDSS